MSTTITNLRSTRGVGIFANRNATSANLNFRKYNLIYGFNGSGKSTLSRLFASLEAGALHPKLPEGCSFDVTMDDGGNFGCPAKPNGLERRLLVFNEDYIEQNLRWSSGLANPMFFIGIDQAEAAAQLAEVEAQINQHAARKTAAEAAENAADKNFATFKRDRAKITASHLHLGNRKYEAPALARDYENWAQGDAQTLTDDQLKAAEDTRRLAEPMPRIEKIEFDSDSILKAYLFISEICGQSLATVELDEAQRFPEMLLWLKQGHEFHQSNGLGDCLFCGEAISAERKFLLASALDDKIDQFVSKLAKTAERLHGVISTLGALEESAPNSDALAAELRGDFGEARKVLINNVREAKKHLDSLGHVLAAKRERPASPADMSLLSDVSAVEIACGDLGKSLKSVNTLIELHNTAIADFAKRKENAELAIRKHFIAQSRDDYAGHAEQVRVAKAEFAAAASEFDALNITANDLRQKIKAHGPAAEAINKLIASYLGHNELTIHPVEDGYQLHRHGNPIAGLPSEGEKTAIALSYFLSSIEAEGRKLKDTIVVIDDPVSSLDTKALNYACSLVRSRLNGACQLFLLTHNQQCMNEFRKAWKGRAKPPEGKEPTATFLFIDVAIAQGEGKRSSKLVEMSRLLREYDSEYHFLFSHVLAFAEAPDKYYEYGYMMPNVLRRVLDVFLAFKCPGSSGLPGQIERLCVDYPDLDRDRLAALERLAQVESHSDNLDDLLSFSSMALEETKGAAIALLAMIEHVDRKHLAALKRLCR